MRHGEQVLSSRKHNLENLLSKPFYALVTVLLSYKDKLFNTYYHSVSNFGNNTGISKTQYSENSQGRKGLLRFAHICLDSKQSRDGPHHVPSPSKSKFDVPKRGTLLCCKSVFRQSI